MAAEGRVNNTTARRLSGLRWQRWVVGTSRPTWDPSYFFAPLLVARLRLCMIGSEPKRGAMPPKYRVIADDIRRRISAGEWPVGSYLPGISTLMFKYEVKGLNTIRHAQSVLVEEGLVRPEPGRGVLVLGQPRTQDKRRAEDIVTQIRQLLAELEAVL